MLAHIDNRNAIRRLDHNDRNLGDHLSGCDKVCNSFMGSSLGIAAEDEFSLFTAGLLSVTTFAWK
jgi:hypothetical protein